MIDLYWRCPQCNFYKYIHELHLQERNTAGVEEGTEKPMINDKSNNATNDYATQGEEKYMYA